MEKYSGKEGPMCLRVRKKSGGASEEKYLNRFPINTGGQKSRLRILRQGGKRGKGRRTFAKRGSTKRNQNNRGRSIASRGKRKALPQPERHVDCIVCC